jgi:hypothetical protein
MMAVTVRLPAVIIVVAWMVSALVAPPPAGASGRPAARPQALATLLISHKVVSAPHDRSSRIGTVGAWRPITGGQTVLPVIGRTTTDGVHWLHVRVPGRPNGMKGWIAQRGTELTTTRWRVVVRTSSRRVLVYREGRLVRSFAAIVASLRHRLLTGGSSSRSPYACSPVVPAPPSRSL